MRMIDMIVVHCSATRSNRRYPLEQLRHDHVAVNGWRETSGITSTSPLTVWFTLVARSSGWVLTPEATTPIPSASAMRED